MTAHIDKGAFPETRRAWGRLQVLLREAIAWKLFHIACRVSPEWHQQLMEDHFRASVRALAAEAQDRHA